MIDLMQYPDVLKNLKACSSNYLFLGNGFSVGFDKSFSIHEDDYINFASVSDEELREMISREDEAFENGGKQIIRVIGDSRSDYTLKLSIDVVSFIEDLLKNHPRNSESLPDENAKVCFKFLLPYLETGAVYTTNYDMMLDWVIHKIDGIKYRDGFIVPSDDEHEFGWAGDDVNIFYCNGALNLFGASPSCNKLVSDEQNLSYIENRIGTGADKDYPVCVDGGDSSEKVRLIEKYDYLKACQEELKKIKGNLVVFGFSGDIKDTHILESIAKAQKQNDLKIFWGIYGNQDSETIEELNGRLGDVGIREVNYFDSKSVPVWS